MATGGLTKGKSHKEGGIPMKVKNTGQNIEVEGGEIIINKKNVADNKKHTFDGKELTKCEIASEINSANGNGVEIDCDSVEGKKYKYKKGGTIMSSKIKSKVFDENGKRKIDDKSIKELTTYINSLPQTKSKHFNNTTKRYSKKRRELHIDIINSFIGDVVCIEQDEPIAILMGGSPASGKSSFLKKYAPYLLKEDLLRIDADEVRSMLPEYEGWNASQTHLETKDIVETLLSDRTIGIPCEFDLIYDGTMNNTKSYKPLIALLKKLGYTIFAVYIDNVPYEVIKKRALERYQESGRFVPMEVIDDFFEKGKKALNKIKEQVDGYMIIDGSNRDYEIIEKGGMQLPKTRKYAKLGYPISEHFNTDFPALVNNQNIKYGEFYAKGGLTQSKAKKILEDGVANGKPLTKKQKVYMNLIAKGGMSKFEKGGVKANAGLLLAGQVLADPNARKDILEFTRSMQQMKQGYEQGGNITGNDIEKLIPYYQLQALKEGEIEIASGKREEPLFLDTLNEAYKLVPKVYAQDGKDLNAVAYFHYFMGGTDVYITELDKDSLMGFGYTIHNGDTQMSSLGDVYIPELTDKSLGNAFNNMNIDQYFNPQTLNQIFQSKYPELVKGEVEIYEDKKEVEVVEVVETSDYLAMDFKNPYERNIVIRGLIDEKGNQPNNYTIEEKEFIGLYSGMGGLEKYGASEGLLFEYYTPKDIVEKMWGLAFKHKLGTMLIKDVLEPSVATGNFVGYAPKDVNITGYDIDKYAYSICQVLYGTGSDFKKVGNVFFNSSFDPTELCPPPISIIFV